MTDRCEHFDAIRAVAPSADRCEACAVLGAPWVRLRICLTCGQVGCCEDSRHAHALAHHLESGHPMIASLERDEHWGWCYPHRRYFEPMPGPLPKLPSRFLRLVRRLARRKP
ncbi:MAG: UBP-type zinc finger domain-containing protein [Betaproteobacteria bacterium]